jgi:cytochrome c5
MEMDAMNNRIWIAVRTAALSATLALAACGSGEAPQSAAAPAAPAAAAAPAVLNTYEHTCRNCHSVPASGAPQLADAKAWAPRLAQGRETLLDHAINGYKAMPPMGTCTACSEQDFTALIEYMSGSQLK